MGFVPQAVKSAGIGLLPRMIIDRLKNKDKPTDSYIGGSDMQPTPRDQRRPVIRPPHVY
jgi:hypothetical protein